MIGASFDSTKKPLQELLAHADSGKLQLPDFQRGWVWDDDRIKSLLASVSVSFPIGAVMLLETGGENIRFKPRPLAGTHERLRTVSPETLILDGQQRLTSLYQAFYGVGEHRYFLDLGKLRDGGSPPQRPPAGANLRHRNPRRHRRRR
jgi:uncharacterized protein with ParB-like and HNH nuclease domain